MRKPQKSLLRSVTPGANTSPRFPAMATVYPASRRMAQRFGSHGFRRLSRVRCPDTCGYHDVMIDTRLGPQTECCNQASVHRTPRAARASNDGVEATVLP